VDNIGQDTVYVIRLKSSLLVFGVVFFILGLCAMLMLDAGLPFIGSSIKGVPTAAKGFAYLAIVFVLVIDLSAVVTRLAVLQCSGDVVEVVYPFHMQRWFKPLMHHRLSGVDRKSVCLNVGGVLGQGRTQLQEFTLYSDRGRVKFSTSRKYINDDYLERLRLWRDV